MNRLFSLLLLLTFAAALNAIPLNIFYTGDTHGVYNARLTSKETRIWNGGYLLLEQHLQCERQASPRSIYLDSGDQQTGTIFSSLVEDGVHGGAVIEVFNRLGLDASTFGNHEFDFSYGNTRDLVRKAKYSFVSTNLLDKATRKSVGREPYTIIEKDSLRIGILGITLEILPEKVKAQNVSSVRILDPKTAIDQYLDELDLKSDLIVVLTHQGFEADSLLAESLDSRVDIIIGGHDHISIDQAFKVNGIYLLYSGSHLNFLGDAAVDVVNDRVASLVVRLIPLTAPTAVFLSPLAEYIQTNVERIEAEMSKVIGYTTEDWTPDKYQSTAVSRWVAAALKAEYQELYKPDLAIINNGGIRKHIPAGAVTLGDMNEMLPFNNTVVVFSCWGRDILAFEELNARHAIEKPHDICQTSAPGFYGEPCKGDEHWIRYDLGDKQLDPDTVYTIVSHDYIVGQWDKYLGFKPFDVYDTGELILDAMVRQVQKQFAPPEEEGRD